MIKHLPMHIDMKLISFTFRLQSNIKIGNENECWLWTGTATGRPNNLRPHITFKGKMYIATRITYYLAFNKDPKELLVCHECDNTLCMNPSHLFLGNSQDNTLDSILKGRGNRPKEVNNAMTKLLDYEVENLRALYASGQFNQVELAIKFNITKQQVCNIVNRKQRI